MTQNQLAYLGLRETKRNNIVTSMETARHNRAGEGETNRHNIVTERISEGELNERKRHNQAGEAETNRHNIVVEDQGKQGLDIQRSGLEETNRHNVASESLTRQQIATSKENAKIAANASKYGADKSAQASTSNAKTAAAASKYGADAAAKSSKYQTDTNRKIQEAQRKWQRNENIETRLLDQWKTSITTANQKDIADARNQTDKIIKDLDRLASVENVDKQVKAQIDKAKKDYQLGIQRNEISLITSGVTGLFSIGKSISKMIGG